MTRPRTSARATRTVERADIAVARASAPAGGHPLTAMLRTVAELADQPPMIASTLGLTLIGAATRDRATMRTGLRMLAGVAFAIAAKSVVKNAVDRTRPHLLVEQAHYRMGRGTADESAVNSFPSGHTADAVAAAALLARDRRDAAPWGWGWAMLVGATQVPTRRHFASDVVAGAAIGLAAAWLANRLIPPDDSDG